MNKLPIFENFEVFPSSKEDTLFVLAYLAHNYRVSPTHQNKRLLSIIREHAIESEIEQEKIQEAMVSTRNMDSLYGQVCEMFSTSYVKSLNIGNEIVFPHGFIGFVSHSVKTDKEPMAGNIGGWIDVGVEKSFKVVEKTPSDIMLMPAHALTVDLIENNKKHRKKLWPSDRILVRLQDNKSTIAMPIGGTNESLHDVSDQIIDAAIAINLHPSQFVHTIKGKNVEIEFGSNVKSDVVAKFGEELEKMGLSVKAIRSGISVHESLNEDLALSDDQKEWANIRGEFVTNRIVKIQKGLPHISGKTLKASLSVTNKKIPLIHDSTSGWRYEVRTSTDLIHAQAGFRTPRDAQDAAVAWADSSINESSRSNEFLQEEQWLISNGLLPTEAQTSFEAEIANNWWISVTPNQGKITVGQNDMSNVHQTTYHDFTNLKSVVQRTKSAARTSPDFSAWLKRMNFKPNK